MIEHIHNKLMTKVKQNLDIIDHDEIRETQDNYSHKYLKMVRSLINTTIPPNILFCKEKCCMLSFFVFNNLLLVNISFEYDGTICHNVCISVMLYNDNITFKDNKDHVIEYNIHDPAFDFDNLITDAYIALLNTYEEVPHVKEVGKNVLN